MLGAVSPCPDSNFILQGFLFLFHNNARGATQFSPFNTSRHRLARSLAVSRKMMRHMGLECFGLWKYPIRFCHIKVRDNIWERKRLILHMLHVELCIIQIDCTFSRWQAYWWYCISYSRVVENDFNTSQLLKWTPEPWGMKLGLQAAGWLALPFAF